MKDISFIYVDIDGYMSQKSIPCPCPHRAVVAHGRRLPDTPMAHRTFRTRCLFFLLIAGATMLYVLILMEAPRDRNRLYARTRLFHKDSQISEMEPMSPLDVTTHEQHILQDNLISGNQIKEVVETRPPNTTDHEHTKGSRNEVNLIERSQKEETEADNKRTYVSSEETYSHNSNTCSPRQNIAFLKVHKAGSTTVSNILQRYAVRNDLNLVLPDKLVGEAGYNILGYGPFFSADMVIPVPEGQTFNILCNHVVYNRRVMNELMPAGTFYVAIVRSLEERFMSAMNYFGQVGLIVEEMKGTPGFKLNDVMSHFFINQRVHGIYKESIINSIAYDFGFPTYSDDDKYKQSYLQKIDKEFDFVMIMEYFDESLVLLRRRLCWSLRDILYIRRNSYAHSSLPLTEKDRHKLYESQQLDHRIYQHFYSKFWDEILAEGRDIFHDVANFKRVQKQVFDFCRRDRKGQNALNIPSSKWNDAFKLTTSDCRQMKMSELMQVKKVMDRARERLRRDGTDKQWLKYVQKFRQRYKKHIRNFETFDELFNLRETNDTQL